LKFLDWDDANPGIGNNKNNEILRLRILGLQSLSVTNVSSSEANGSSVMDIALFLLTLSCTFIRLSSAFCSSQQSYLLTLMLYLFFTRESSYCFQRVLAIAILSVRLSVTRVDQAKTAQAMITKFSPSAAWKTLVSGTVKLFYKFERDHPERGR